MAQVLTEFYVFVRSKVVADLTRVRFYDAAGAVSLSLTTADTRLVWSVQTGNPIKLVATLDGTELAGYKIKTIKLFRESDTTYANPVTEETLASEVTLASGNTYKFEHTIEIPDIP